ncbi:MAG: methyltransferase domain-containing protein, partial [Candidatus Sumerlaeota bacterium]
MLPWDAKKFWRSTRAVESARHLSLTYARQELGRRAAQSAQVFTDSHDSFTHLNFFREQFPQVIADLPRGFTAIEIGAGMGWHSALVASHGGNGCTVLATEFAWAKDKRPHDEPNLHAYHRLGQRDEKLKSFLEFSRDAAGNLNGVAYRGALGFARAGGEALPAADGCADLVYTVNCIEHIPDLPATFAEAARVLRIGGVFLGTTEPLYFSPFGHHLADVFP